MIYLNNPIKPDLKFLNSLLSNINDNGWYTNFGPYHEELTYKLEQYLGVNNLLLVNNGTSALQVAAKALDCNSIIATPFSFVATVSAFKWNGNKVSFSDIDNKSLNINSKEIDNIFKQGSEADTIVATHVYGNPCAVKDIQHVAEKHNKKVIYDAAHAFGVNVHNESVLNFGDASTLSFHATKVFHSIEGGAIVFKERANFDKAKELINFGINPEKGIQHIGINAKLNEYQAAVGLTILKEMPNVINYRAELFHYYRNQLKDIVSIPTWNPSASVNGAYMPILLKSKEELDKLSIYLEKNNIQSRNYFSPSLDTVFDSIENYGTKISKNISERILCLPMHTYLTFKDVDYIIKTIKKIL